MAAKQDRGVDGQDHHAEQGHHGLGGESPEVALRAHRGDQQVEGGIAEGGGAGLLEPRERGQGEQQGKCRDQDDGPGEGLQDLADGRERFAGAEGERP